MILANVASEKDRHDENLYFQVIIAVQPALCREDGKRWLTAMVFTTRTSGPGIEPGQKMNH